MEAVQELNIAVIELEKAEHNCVRISVQQKQFLDVAENKWIERASSNAELQQPVPMYGEQARFFQDEFSPLVRHDCIGCVSWATVGKDTNGSQFCITTRSDNLRHLDDEYTLFGKVVMEDEEGEESKATLTKINEAYCDDNGKPWQNIKIKEIMILDEDEYLIEEFRKSGLVVPDRVESVVDSGIRIDDDETLDEYDGKTKEEVEEERRIKEAKSRAQVLEMVGDIPDAEYKAPENILFVCKLNPVTEEEDLILIFERFGKIKACDIIRDWKTGDSLQYAFIEFADQKSCERAYKSMENVLIDDRRIHVDFSQSVTQMAWDYHHNKTKYTRGGVRSFAGVIDVKKSSALPGGLVLKKDANRHYDMVFDAGDSDRHKAKPQYSSRYSHRRRSRSRDRDRGRRDRDGHKHRRR